MLRIETPTGFQSLLIRSRSLFQQIQSHLSSFEHPERKRFAILLAQRSSIARGQSEGKRMDGRREKGRSFSLVRAEMLRRAVQVACARDRLSRRR